MGILPIIGYLVAIFGLSFVIFAVILLLAKNINEVDEGL